jgi:hypothetical protein
MLEKQRRISLEHVVSLGELFSSGYSAIFLLSFNKHLVPNILVIKAFDLPHVVLPAHPPSSCAATPSPLRHQHVFQQAHHTLDVGGFAPHSRHCG